MHKAIALSAALDSDLREAGCTETAWDEDLSRIKIASYMLRSKMLSKYSPDGRVGPIAKENAISVFKDANKRCSETLPLPQSNQDRILLGEFSKKLHDLFSMGLSKGLISDDLKRCFRLGHPGPGATVGSPHTDFVMKNFEGPVGGTSRVLDMFEECVSRENTTLAYAWLNAAVHHGIRDIDYTELVVVPKNVHTGRVISKVPHANMWLQLGFARQLRDVLKAGFGIDLEDQQEKQKLLAKKSSRDDTLSTLDLKSASDLQRMGLLTHFPRWFADMVRFLRVGHYKANKNDDETHELHMISTMGEGFTFPLMTIIMCCVVSAAARVAGEKLVNPKPARHRVGALSGRIVSTSPDSNWGVFGDDIICPAGKTTQLTMRLLDLLGYEVNVQKSFVEGPFRESCGGDYFLGGDVRPVYIKSLMTRADALVAFNNLAMWSVRHVPLINTLSVLRKLIGTAPFVPMHENPDSGIRVPLRFLGAHQALDKNGSVRYRALRASARKVWILPRDTAGAPCRIAETVRLTLEKYLEHEDAVKRARNKSLQIAYGANLLIRCNPWAVMLACTYGALRAGALTPRDEDVAYKATTCVTPSWDSQGPGGYDPCTPARLMDVLDCVF